MAAPRFILDDFWPSDLFLGGIPGAWYDPTDLSTMFQDSTGTTPVTAVEQPVGLILDKSQGLTLGAELVTNGDFSGGTTGWTGSNATLSIVGGALRFTVTANGQAGAYQQIATTAGRTYKATFTFVADAANGNTFFNAGTTTTGAQLASINCGSTTGTYTMYFVATGAISYISVSTSSTALAGQTNDVTGFTVRELAGNHASQATAASRPTYRARYNLLTFSEQFDVVASWAPARGAVTANATVAPDGNTTADKFVEDTATGDHDMRQTASIINGSTYTLSCYFKAAERTFGQISTFGTGLGLRGAVVNLSNGSVQNMGGGYGAFTTAVATPVGNGWYRVVVTATASATGTTTISVGATLTSTGTPSYTGDGTSGLFLWGAQLLTAADVTATGNTYQRIAAATVYDTAPIFRPYLAFDGVDDSLATAAINFTATDKMSVFSGLTKNTDAANGCAFELSSLFSSNNGSFTLFAPNGLATTGFDAPYRGTITNAFPAFNAPAPTSRVNTQLYNIAAPSAVLRSNGAQVYADATSVGTGNFGNYPFFIGRRNNSTFPFNGRLYSLIVRGAASSVTEIADTELWVNARTGAF